MIIDRLNLNDDDIFSLYLLSLIATFVVVLVTGVINGLMGAADVFALVNFAVSLMIGALTAGFSGFVSFIFPWYIGLAAIIILAEAFFWLEKPVPDKKDNKYDFTLKRKAVNLFESGFIVVNISNAVNILKLINFNSLVNILTCIAFYLGVLVLIIVAICGWVYVNSLKFNDKCALSTRFSRASKGVKKHA